MDKVESKWYHIGIGVGVIAIGLLIFLLIGTLGWVIYDMMNKDNTIHTYKVVYTDGHQDTIQAAGFRYHYEEKAIEFIPRRGVVTNVSDVVCIDNKIENK